MLLSLTLVHSVIAIAVVVLKPYFAPPARVDLGPPPSSDPGEARTPSTATGTGEAVAQDERPMVVVLPFENLGPPENAYFADGMTEEITSRLACVKALGVISRTSAVQYDRIGKTMRQIGEDLGVDYVLEGTVRWDGSMASERTIIPIPPIHWVTLLQKSKPLGKDSISFKIDAPVVVKPDMVSKKASVIVAI